MQHQRVVDAIKKSGVKHIAIVDDAFDPPTLQEPDFGILLDFLQNAPDTLPDEAGVTNEIWTAAIDALLSGEYDDIAVEECVAALYSAFIGSSDSKFDPGSRFKDIKADNLRNVLPIVQFLSGLGADIKISKFGANLGDVEVPDGELVVFVDLYLSAHVAADADPTTEAGHAAVRESLNRIKPLLKNQPSIILMSSHENTAAAATYRRNITGKVYASRFGFIPKRQVEKIDQKKFKFGDDAASTLLDVFQSYKFGRGLHAAFERWGHAATSSVTQMQAQIANLELRDISYLTRFRLADEGQDIWEYLEWLLAECLVDELGKQLDKQPTSPELAYLTTEEAKEIGGAFDGPTETVAMLYHRVRVEDKRAAERKNFRLGDIYLKTEQGQSSEIVAVMNPDCDLMLRPDGERGAKTLLTLHGTLEDFNVPKTSIGDFIIIDGVPKNVSWNYKHIRTMAFDGPMARAGLSEAPFRFLGSLRPLYGQEIQANLLNQLGRVGVAVPPALAFSATVKLYCRQKNGDPIELQLGDAAVAQCYFVPARQSSHAGKAVFTHKFVQNLSNAIEGLDKSTLQQDDIAIVQKVLTSKVQRSIVNTTYAGIALEAPICEGVWLTAKEAFKPSKDSKNPLWVVLSVAIPAGIAEVDLGLPVPPQHQIEEDASPVQSINEPVLAGLGDGAEEKLNDSQGSARLPMTTDVPPAFDEAKEMNA